MNTETSVKDRRGLQQADPTGGDPGVDGDPRPNPLLVYGRQVLWNVRRRVKVEVAALRSSNHPTAHDQAARFGALYADEEDPFHYGSDAYEQRKYDLALAMLPSGSFDRAYEPGCSIGEFTARLAPRCGTLLASDVSDDALSRAHRRLWDFDNVVLERHLLPRDYPAGRFDLIVMAEFGYYLEPPALKELVQRLADSVTPRGYLMAVHGRGATRDIYWPGDIVHRHLLLTSGLRQVGAYREEAFRIDLLQRA